MGIYRLYSFAHWLRDQMPTFWQVVERANGSIFRLRYARRLRRIEPIACQKAAPYQMVRIKDIPTEELVAFFHAQPEEIYLYFTPHGFEAADVAKLQHNPSFVAYVLKIDEKIVGYFFLRSYCNGICYFGRMVSQSCMKQGIGTLISTLSFYLSESLHLQSYQSISKDNIASYTCASRACRLQPVGTTANGEVLYKNYPL